MCAQVLSMQSSSRPPGCPPPCAVLSDSLRREVYDLRLLDQLDVEVGRAWEKLPCHVKGSGAFAAAPPHPEATVHRRMRPSSRGGGCASRGTLWKRPCLPHVRLRCRGRVWLVRPVLPCHCNSPNHARASHVPARLRWYVSLQEYLKRYQGFILTVCGLGMSSRRGSASLPEEAPIALLTAA